MTTAILDPVAPSLLDGGDEDGFTHFTCCRPDLAMCGADLSDGEDVAVMADDEPMCTACIYVDEEGVPCPTPGCTGGAR